MALLAARCKAVRRVQASNPDKSEAEIFSKLVSYTSEQVSTKRCFQSYLCPFKTESELTLISLILPNF